VRKKSVRQKLNPIASEFAGKNVLLVDDSIVRGTTSHEIVQMARDAGAKKVYFASAAPAVRFPNVYGIDMPTRAELLATNRDDVQIAAEIGADAVIYQDLEALKQAVRFPFPSENGYSRPSGRPHTRRQRALHHWLKEWEKGQLVIRSCFGRPFLPAFLPLPAYGSTERGG
jgi:hypothetical protein